jgi:hypothetical protein
MITWTDLLKLMNCINKLKLKLMLLKKTLRHLEKRKLKLKLDYQCTRYFLVSMSLKFKMIMTKAV